VNTNAMGFPTGRTSILAFRAGPVIKAIVAGFSLQDGIVVVFMRGARAAFVGGGTETGKGKRSDALGIDSVSEGGRVAVGNGELLLEEDEKVVVWELREGGGLGDVPEGIWGLVGMHGGRQRRWGRKDE
jgi:hypothetical protein